MEIYFPQRAGLRVERSSRYKCKLYTKETILGRIFAVGGKYFSEYGAEARPYGLFRLFLLQKLAHRTLAAQAFRKLEAKCIC